MEQVEQLVLNHPDIILAERRMTKNVSRTAAYYIGELQTIVSLCFLFFVIGITIHALMLEFVFDLEMMTMQRLCPEKLQNILYHMLTMFDDSDGYVSRSKLLKVLIGWALHGSLNVLAGNWLAEAASEVTCDRRAQRHCKFAIVAHMFLLGLHVYELKHLNDQWFQVGVGVIKYRGTVILFVCRLWKEMGGMALAYPATRRRFIEMARMERIAAAA